VAAGSPYAPNCSLSLSCSPHPVYHVSTLPDLPAAGSPHHASFTCGRFIVSSNLLDVAALHPASGIAHQRAAGSPRRRLLTPPASPVAGSPHPPNWSRSTRAHHPKILRGRGKRQGRRVLSRRTGTFMADAVVCKWKMLSISPPIWERKSVFTFLWRDGSYMDGSHHLFSHSHLFLLPASASPPR
jgi:hypothetical protein